MISVESLSFRYPGQEADNIRDISFAIEAGESFGFLGPSGSGKSTTQKLLIGLLRNYRGNLRVLDREVRDWGQALYHHVGVGFELPNHFLKLSARENLALFASFYADTKARESVDSLLQRVGLSESANQRVSEYSKGMKMRLNFARALLHDPKILFLDEPTAGLDPVTAKRIKDIIRELQAKGTTVFLTTHNMHDADELCDRVAFLVEGQLKLVGAPQALKHQYGKSVVRVEQAVTATQGSAETGQFVDYPLAGLAENTDFLDRLRSNKILSIHSQEASLEDVFIAATGTRLS